MNSTVQRIDAILGACLRTGKPDCHVEEHYGVWVVRDRHGDIFLRGDPTGTDREQLEELYMKAIHDD